MGLILLTSLLSSDRYSSLFGEYWFCSILVLKLHVRSRNLIFFLLFRLSKLGLVDLREGRAYLEYIAALYQLLKVDLSMFSNFCFRFESKLTNMALGEFISATSDSKKLIGLSIIYILSC